MTATPITQQTVDIQLERARRESERNPDCVVHVNAVVQFVLGYPVVTHLFLSDWHAGDSTIQSFVNGRRLA